MPCRDDYGSTDPNVYDRLNPATRVACEMGNAICDLKDKSTWDELSKETKKWVIEHEKEDRRRRQREREESMRQTLRKKTLKKLSKEEREALGV